MNFFISKTYTKIQLPSRSGKLPSSLAMSSIMWVVGIVILLVGLLQLPLLMDLVRSCAPKSAKMPKRLAGPIIDTIVVTVMR